jgi:hypothetical protein
VPVGQLIAVIAEPADDIGAVVAERARAPAPAAAPAPRRGSAPAPAAAPRPASSGAANAKPADIPPAAAPGPVPQTETYKSVPATDKVVPPRSRAWRAAPAGDDGCRRGRPGGPASRHLRAARGRTRPGRSRQGLASGKEGRGPVGRGSLPAAG